MKIDSNKILNKVCGLLEKIISIYKPSLARALIVPTSLAGIAILSPPWWLDLINWVVTNQNFVDEYKKAISETDPALGWGLLGYSLLVFILESLKVLVEKRITENTHIPEETADLVIKKIGELPSSASHIIDEKINKRIAELQNLRFFQTYPKEEKAIQLATEIIGGDLAGGSSPVKALGLAQSARYLSVGDNIEKAKKYVEESKKLTYVREIKIAEAFIKTIDADVDDGIAILVGDDNITNYSAIFMLRRAKQGAVEAINWLDNARLNIESLDIDGQFSLISALLEINKWERALEEVYKLRNTEEISSPALAQIIAFTLLTNSIKAIELRKSVMQQIPFAAESFPLSDDTQSIRLRVEAIKMFNVCAESARFLGAIEVSEVSERYALWLELRNPDTVQIAEAKLKKHLSYPSYKALEYLPLAFAFKINLDYSKVEEEVNRMTALSNGENPALGVARLVLAFNQKDHSKTIEYINTHREQLVKNVTPETINMLEIEVLAKAGLIEDAEELCSKLEIAGTIPEQIRILKSLIASVKGEDSVALAILQYNKTENISDLAQLVNVLESSNLKEKGLFYSLKLFKITGTEQDALRVANALSINKHFAELYQFLGDNFELVERSASLMFHWAWSLFRKGSFEESKERLLELKNRGVNNQHLDLQSLDVSLAIYTGDWDSLTVIIENSWVNRNDLSAEELMQVAQLAKAIFPKRAKEILEYTTSRFPENPNVLASAYFTATTLGWEDKKDSSDWLNKAVKLSNDEGPLHKTSLDEFKSIITAQREKNDNVYKAYDEGSVPIFLIANLLNRTLSDFYLIQPIENLNSTDIRKKSYIGAFHSSRLEKVIVGKRASVDTSSLLVLGQLDLLKQLFEVFTQIILPHSLNRWLFDEKQKIAFHQPSQIQKAKEIEALVVDNIIKIIEPREIKEANLALDVGEDLTLLLEYASDNSSIDQQALVTCSYPVYKIDGFSNQIIELSEYKENLISCTTLVKKLKDIEMITEDEYEKAFLYLKQHDQEWPSSPRIADNASIYLDSLSLTYLMSVGILGKFKNTDLKVFIHRNEFENFKKLRAYDSAINEADTKLEQIRKELFKGIQAKKVIFSSKPISDGEAEGDRLNQPTEELFQAITESDVVLVDDRFINQHGSIAIDNKNTPIFTSLDFIETLYANQIISQKTKFSYRAKLREAGFGLVPITIEELNYHLDKSSIIDGIFRPTKELKLIKQNLSLLKINRLIKLPRDAEWLISSLRSLSSALKSQWSEDNSIEVSCARSNWLYDLLDYRGWSHCLETRPEEGMAYVGEMIRVNTLLIAPEELNDALKVQYFKWLESNVLLPLSQLDPATYGSLIESIKEQIKKLVSKCFLEGDMNE